MIRAVHQVLAGAAPRDAITNHALLARDVIRSMGLRSEIFCDAQHLADELTHHIRPHTDWDSCAGPRDRAILHYSIDSAAFAYVQERTQGTAIHYHNITPPNLLWRDAPALAWQCAQGRERLPEFAARSSAGAADSIFNARELREAGGGDVTVVGVLRHVPDTGAGRNDQAAPRGTDLRLLFVGRGVPNKCQHDLILATGALTQAGVPATVALAGSWGGNRAYLIRCQNLVRELGLQSRVRFLGSVSDQQLDALYRNTDVFLCMSEHEGYCVPLLEAMDRNLPIVAYAAGAVPETLGLAGLLLTDKAPSIVAEAVIEVASNEALRQSMSAARVDQLAHHAPAAVRARLEAFIQEFAH